MADFTEKFTDRAQDYTMARPSYANSFIDYLYNVEGFSKNSIIADIGSGTGKFSKQLLDRGSKVFCVEPNDDMRNIAKKNLNRYSCFVSVNATASDTALKQNSVDFITVAQAFHWFDCLEFKRESKRILKDNGKVFLIWNTREDKAQVNMEIERINYEFCRISKGSVVVRKKTMTESNFSFQINMNILSLTIRFFMIMKVSLEDVVQVPMRYLVAIKDMKTIIKHLQKCFSLIKIMELLKFQIKLLLISG